MRMSLPNQRPLRCQMTYIGFAGTNPAIYFRCKLYGGRSQLRLTGFTSTNSTGTLNKQSLVGLYTS